MKKKRVGKGNQTMRALRGRMETRAGYRERQKLDDGSIGGGDREKGFAVYRTPSKAGEKTPGSCQIDPKGPERNRGNYHEGNSPKRSRSLEPEPSNVRGQF